MVRSIGGIISVCALTRDKGQAQTVVEKVSKRVRGAHANP